MSLKILITSLASLFLVTAANAQDVIVEDDVAIVEQAPADDAVIVRGSGLAPRVYGWTLRPADCGTFRYWNGERCADARDEPPVPN
jgi:hypothetical protein